MKQIGIISEDIIFIKLLETFLLKKSTDITITCFSSYAQITKEIDNYALDIILIDGIMSGAASFEIMVYLRYTKKIICPFYFFSQVGQEFFKTKAFYSGANRYFEKPFDHHAVTNEILKELEK